MSPLTPALISYWHTLPARTVAERRQALHATRDAVRLAQCPSAALLPFALGDVDGEIVREATRAYVALHAGTPPGRRVTALEEAIDWIRRGLALNRGAVFAALLAEAEPWVDERLAAARLTTPIDDVAPLCRQLPARAQRTARRFLDEWRELLEDAGDLTVLRQPDGAAVSTSGRIWPSQFE